MPMVYKGALRQERTANSSFLILLLFGISFAAVGVIALVVAIQRFLTGSAPLIEVAVLMIFALGMQTGGASGTPYYDIQLICRDGRKRVAGSQIRNKREAVWVMNQMRQALRP